MVADTVTLATPDLAENQCPEITMLDVEMVDAYAYADVDADGDIEMIDGVSFPSLLILCLPSSRHRGNR